MGSTGGNIQDYRFIEILGIDCSFSYFGSTLAQSSLAEAERTIGLWENPVPKLGRQTRQDKIVYIVKTTL